MTHAHFLGHTNMNQLAGAAKPCHEDARVKAETDLLLDRLSSESGGESLLKGQKKAVQRGEHRSGCSSCQLGKQQVARHLHIIVVLHVRPSQILGSSHVAQPHAAWNRHLLLHLLFVNAFDESPRQQM